MTSHKLKIGLDYHGVIDCKLSYFADFCALARHRGHLIYIITGGPMFKVRQLLTKQGIEYDFIFAISDYCQALGEIEQDLSGDLVVPEHCWNKAKADFCRRNHINFHIDDSKEYLRWFSTPFCLYDQASNTCTISQGLRLDLSHSPEDIIKYLENIALL